MSLGVTYPKFSSKKCRNKLLKFKPCSDKKWNSSSNMQQLNVPHGEHIWDGTGSVHAEFYEFIMHRKENIDLQLFSFSEICTLKE
jgi:hypothetical protein